MQTHAEFAGFKLTFLRRWEIRNPANCELVGTVPDFGAAAVDRAVAAARAAFENKVWRGLDPSKRERILWNIGELLLKYRDELANV